jgi:nicotinamidase-related amidase
MQKDTPTALSGTRVRREPAGERLTKLDPTRCAVLALDFTPMIVANYATDGEIAAANAVTVCDAARAAGAAIILVIPGMTDKEGQPVSRAGDLLASFAPREADRLLHKDKIGAFSTTGLDTLLRESGRETLIITGIATSGTVLSTARWAFDVGYRLFVVEDACSDPDREVHDLLTRPVHPTSWVGLWRIATIVCTRDLVDALGQVTP